MNIKVLNSLTSKIERNNDTIVIGTHNGIFHSDDVLACAILSLLNYNSDIIILRSREPSVLSNSDICVDIGGGTYDHHQIGFNQTRADGVKYASAGLIWRDYGMKLIKLLSRKYFPDYIYNSNHIFEEFDKNFIIPVDCEDNGIICKNHCFSFIHSFLPSWFNSEQDDYNNQFFMVIMTTINILQNELRTIIGREISKTIIKSNWMDENYFFNGILEIPSQTIDWVETIIQINETSENRKVNFVIFPYPSGGWASQCVPPSIHDRFAQRIPFPSEWGGQTDNLPMICGITGATFCHNGCFFIRANTKKDVIEMCTIATNSFY